MNAPADNSLSCPRCQDNGLVTHVVPGDISIDYCQKCNGVWFDCGELGSNLSLSKDLPDFDKLVASGKKTDAGCPKCEKNLVEGPFPGQSTLSVDVCPNCKGVWLDGGEFQAIEKLVKSGSNVKLNLLRAMYNLKAKLGGNKALQCPACEKKNVYPIKTGEGVTMDFCQACKGVWFDHGEVGRSVELSTDIPEFDKVYKLKKPGKKVCPKCPTAHKMVHFPYSTKGDMEIDYCEGCKGIWLDASELHKLEAIAPYLESQAKRLLNAKKELEAMGYIALGESKV